MDGTPAPGTGSKGLPDEVRITSQACSAEWIRLEATAGATNSKLLAYGEDQSAQSGTSGYLQTILPLAGAISLDGWIVIDLIGKVPPRTIRSAHSLLFYGLSGRRRHTNPAQPG